MIPVTPRARSREDRAGDPLEGLVNLFDLGIVLAVAFLLAALASLNLTKTITKTGLARPDVIQVQPGQTVHNLPTPGATTIGRGSQVGTVYQLPDGRLIYVTGPSATIAPGATPTASGSPTASPSSSPTSSPSSSPSSSPTSS